MEKDTQPKELWCTVHDEIISANSIKELDEKFAALGIDENATVGIGAKVVAISTRTTNPKPTIRRLRRQIRHLRSLLKTKDRLLASQKSFYEAMLDDVQKREGTSKESVEEWFKKMLLRTIKSLETTYGVNQ